MNEDLAKRRFMVLSAVRLSGVALALAGLAVIGGKLELPMWAGYILFGAGLFEAMILPIVLAKGWKSDR